MKKLHAGTRRGTIPCSPTEVNILHSFGLNGTPYSAASYFKDTLVTSPSLQYSVESFDCCDVSVYLYIILYLLLKRQQHGTEATQPAMAYWSLTEKK